MKKWIVKHITKRDIRDIHRKQIEIIKQLNCNNVLDVAPPKTINFQNHLKFINYVTIGLDEEYDQITCDVKHDLDIYPYPIKDDSYDIVILSNIIEHLKEPEKAICEAKRISRKWILVALPFPVPISAPEIKHPHIHLWNDENGIKRFIEKCGINNYQQFYIYNNPKGKYMPLFMRKFLANINPRRFARNWFYLMERDYD